MLNFMLLARRPNFTEVARTILKVEQACSMEWKAMLKIFVFISVSLEEIHLCYLHCKSEDRRAMTERVHRAYSFSQLLGAYAKLRKATISFVLSVRLSLSARINSVLTGRIFKKFDIWVFF
jgi:hypothetical protein